MNPNRTKKMGMQLKNYKTNKKMVFNITVNLSEGPAPSFFAIYRQEIKNSCYKTLIFCR